MREEEKQARIKEILQRIREKQAQAYRQQQAYFTPPRYDDVYFEALRILDEDDDY